MIGASQTKSQQHAGRHHYHGSILWPGCFRRAFYSERVFFTPSREVLFAVVNVTIQSGQDDRNHATTLHLGTAEGDVYDEGRLDAYDADTVKGSMLNITRLYPGVTYSLRLYSYGFEEGEAVTVTIELLNLETTFAEVTRNVLVAAEADPATNALAFGFSEASFSRLMDRRITAPEIQVGVATYLTLQVGLDSYADFPHVAIDVDAEEIIILGSLLLVIYPTGGDMYDPSAVVRAGVRVTSVPAMVTSTQDVLQLQFRAATITPDSVEIVVRSEADILSGYPSIDAFGTDVQSWLDQIIQAQGPLGFVIPAYIASRDMPDYWNRPVNMELAFRRFDYRTVTTHGINVAYLFAVFSVRSLDLPMPCYCETEAKNVQVRKLMPPISLDRLSFAPSSDPKPTLRNTRRSFDSGSFSKLFATANTTAVGKQVRTISPNPMPAFYPVHAAAELFSFGISQRAFREVARPYANIGDDQSASTGGVVYASARFWYRSNLQEAAITSEGVSAVVDFTAEGSAKAAVRDRCGNDVLSASVRLRIRIEDTKVGWVIGIEQESEEPFTMTVTGIPNVSIGNITVDFDHPGDPPPPLDQVDDWVLTTVANMLRPSLNQLAEDKAKIRFIRTDRNNNDQVLRYVENYFFAGEAVVMAGHLGITLG